MTSEHQHLADPSRREPVFVVGMNGSGTTVLLDCLAQHSMLYGFPRETRVIPYLVANQERFGDLENDANFRRLWDFVGNLMPFRLANGGTAPLLPTGWQHCSRDLAGLLNMMFLTFAEREGKHRWCEKSPRYAEQLGLLNELYPHARFVHVVRDGRDCAYSFHRRWHRTPELTITRWKHAVAQARKQGRALGARYLELRFEDLTASPEPWMRKVCAFLDVPFEPAVLQSSAPYLGGASRHGGDQKVALQPNSGKWRDYFSTERADRLEQIAGAALATFGYPTDHPQANRNPGKLRRAFWSAQEALLQYGREIGLKLTGRIERPWSVILSRPLTAYRNRTGRGL